MHHYTQYLIDVAREMCHRRTYGHVKPASARLVVGGAQWYWRRWLVIAQSSGKSEECYHVHASDPLGHFSYLIKELKTKYGLERYSKPTRALLVAFLLCDAFNRGGRGHVRSLPFLVHQ